ncbi:MAG: TonB-dependent receptor, partial [Pseudohongiellaceae bacterium]
EEGLSHQSLWSKYLANTGFGQLEVTTSLYSGNWHPTEQIPERAIGTAQCEDEYCALDNSAGGDTWRLMSTANLTGGDWSASLFAQYYDWQMESNPTYDFQINQFDKRWTFGGRAERTLLQTDRVRWEAGTEFRFDDVSDVGLDHHADGIFINNISDNEVRELSLGAYLLGTWSVTERLRLLGGLRGDYYDFDVKALNLSSFAGQERDSQVSPKLGIAFALTDALEIYGNWGRGFHSNDGRGVVNSIDPVPGLSQGTGQEIGMRTSFGNFKFTGSYWWLEQDSELIFVGDSNSVEPKGGSERNGLELTAFWQPVTWLGIDAVFTDSKARYTDNPEGTHIEAAVEQSAQLGFSAIQDRWEMSLRARYLGPYAMSADNRFRAGDLTTLSWRGAWHWDSLTVYAELINLLDNDGKDIT